MDDKEKKDSKKNEDKNNDKQNVIIDKLPNWDIEPPIEIKRGK
jgi:hypothetical protein